MKSFLIDLQEFYNKNLTCIPVLILNILHFFLKLFQLDQEEQILFEGEQAVNFSVLLEYFLIIISFGNAAFLFIYCKKKYTLLQHPTQEEYPSSEFDSGTYCGLNLGWDLELRTKNARLELLKSDRLVWVLNLWDPYPGNLSLFTFFSPAQVLQISLCNSQNCGLLMLSGYLTAGMVIPI